jgi:hypothetical protein
VIAIALTACLIAHPRHCREVADFDRPESLIACLVASQTAAAAWAVEHPAWRVTRIRCSVGKPEEKRT